MMRQIKTYSDERLEFMCSYCGESFTPEGDYKETKDHVPSRILLDDPFPENLPKVPCCDKCNQSFSLDEEYIACLLECVIHGTVEVAELKREKIKAILSEKEALRKRIMDAYEKRDGRVYFKVEEDRLKNVVVKLAKGHAKYENSAPQFDEPSSISIRILDSMRKEEIESFFSPTFLKKTPEVGSRALSKIVLSNYSDPQLQWEMVQDGRYMYSVSIRTGALVVRIAIWEYLAVEVIWED
jgi:hypothetical protein